jgi:lysophospholipase L1-like esterase
MIFNRLFISGLVSLLLLSNSHAANINVAAFGDSITRGWPYHQNDANGIANNGGYIPGLQSKLRSAWTQVSGVTVYNWGHPGELVTTEGRSRISQVLNSNPDYVLIMEGTNDLPFGIGTGAVFNALSGIINDVSASGAKPVIGTLLPRFDHNSNQNGNIQSINSNLRDLATQNGYALADLYNATPNWNTNMTDGLHPNTTGYSIMANSWFAALQTVPPSGAIPAMLFLLLLSD